MTAIFIPPRIRVTDFQGMPVKGALVTFYEAGTTTLKAIYRDPGLSLPHTNPVVADAGGLLPVIYLTGSYKIRATDAAGVLLFPEVDNLDTPLTSSGGVLGVAQGGTGGATPELARFYLGAAAQATLDALGSTVGAILSTINSYPAFGALAGKSKVAPDDFASNSFAPVCIQRQITLNSVRSSLNGIIPVDNTAPLRSEGDTIFSVNFTPKRSDTVIRARVVAHLAGASRIGAIALFNSIGANDPAIAAIACYMDGAAMTNPVYLEHEFPSPGTSQITVQVNTGANAAYFLNGSGTSGLFNGTMASRLILEEYRAV
jgi:hypothetical protein